MANKNKILYFFGLTIVFLGLFFAWQENVEAVIKIDDCLKIKLSETNSISSVFNCLNENLNILKQNGINLTEIKDQTDDKKIENYQKQRGLKVDGTIGIQTGFDMGFAIGALSTINSNCSSIKISYTGKENTRIFNPKSTIDENDSSDNAKLSIDIFKCLNLIKSDVNNLKTALGSNGISDSVLKKLIIADKKKIKYVGKNFMFEIGKRFGQSGGGIAISGSVNNQGTGAGTGTSAGTTTPSNSCAEYTDLTKKTDGVDSDAKGKDTIECLNSNQERLKENQFDLRKIVGSTAKDIIKDYQKARNLEVDGHIGIQTGFDIGFGIGRISPIADSCKDITVSYNEKSNQPIFYPRFFIHENDTKNKEFLLKVLKCLSLIPEGTNALSTAFGTGQGQITDSLNILTGNGMIIPSTGGKKQVEKKFMFNLGRRFGANGGKIELIPEIDESGDGIEPTSETVPKPPAEPLDYCSNKSIKDLGKDIYSSKSINIIPRNPGVIEWRDVKEVNSEECLTGTELTASLIGRLIRFFELFVAVIAVIMFVYGGFLYMTAQGDEGQHEKSTHIILYGVGGIFIIIMSRIITEIFVPIGDDGLRVDRSKAFTTDIKASSQIFDFTNWALSFASLVAVCMIIYGGYLYMTAAGDDGQQENGKKTIIASVIGLFIIFSAYTIIAILLGGIGLNVN